MATRLFFFALCFGFLLLAAIFSCSSFYAVVYEKGGSLLHQGRNSLHGNVGRGSQYKGALSDRCYVVAPDWMQRTKPQYELDRLECKQRLPKVLIIGARTSGTQTLSRVLGFHPQLATTTFPVKFFDVNYHRGPEWYLDQMPYSRPDQLTIEATEGYMYHKNASLRAVKTLGEDIKIIVIVRDPVARSISDYLLTRSRIRQSKLTSAHYKTAFKELRMHDRLLISGRGKHSRRGSTKMSYTVEETFEQTVLREPDQVCRKNIFIADSLYVYYLRTWVKKFTPYRVLSVNAETFATTPMEMLWQVEKFLGLKSYFKPEHFRFDLNTSTFCIQEPQSICMPKLHVDYPMISNTTISKLRRHFVSSCRYLFLLLKHYLKIIGDLPLNYHPIE